MKLRIKGNALRLRLTQGEIRALADTGQVQERTEFPGGGQLIYRLRSDDEIGELSVGYSGNIIEFRVPSALAQRWCGTDLVTLSGAPRVGADTVQLVLEKDYACRVPRVGEDERDQFSHPGAAQGRRGC